MESVAFIFGMMGFIFGLSAMGQVDHIKKEVQRLRS